MPFLVLTLFMSLSLRADTVTPVEAAQSLAVQKKRQEASEILRKALAATPISLRTRAKLTEALNQITTVFFTDKGQKAFEAGQALMWESPDLALAQFRQALPLEDENIQILNHIARIQLQKQDCDGAVQTLLSSRRLNPYGSESAVLELRALYCQQRFDVLRESAKKLPALDKWQDAFVQYLLAQDLLQQKSFRKSFDAAMKLSEEQPSFPEPYWVLARSAMGLEKESEPWLGKYVSLCKAATPRDRKKFSLEPRLCANLKEAEDELAKQSADF
ncbi:MAG TPA: hypothetical protein PKC28_01050 [Bdellovibrionales bacterium]|nr:hypothetical protein [Bdellovibrionales bacterium]